MMKPPPHTSSSLRERPADFSPRSMAGHATSFKYFFVQKPCNRSPSATPAADSIIFGRTAARYTGTIGKFDLAGVNSGVISVN